MKRVLIILFLLILVLLAATFFFNRTKKSETLLSLRFSDREVELDDLVKFGSQQITTNRNDTFSAYSLLEILISLEEDPEQYSQIIFNSLDGGSLAVSMTEIQDLYLVPIVNNQEKYLRLIIPSDEFPQRWLKYVKNIEFINAAAE